MYKRLFTVSLAFCICLSSFTLSAQTYYRINSVSMEASSHDGYKGIFFYVNLDVFDYLNKTVRIRGLVEFKDSEGNWRKVRRSDNTDLKGYISSDKKYVMARGTKKRRCNKTDTHIDQFEVFLPYKAMTHASGKVAYRLALYIEGEDGAIPRQNGEFYYYYSGWNVTYKHAYTYTNSGTYIDFNSKNYDERQINSSSSTGSSSYASNTSSSSSHPPKYVGNDTPSKEKKSYPYTETTNDGYTTTSKTYFADGRVDVTITNKCALCSGTGKCSMCMGGGYIYGVTNMMPCLTCGSSGKCGVCHGSGQTSHVYSYNQNAPAPSSTYTGTNYQTQQNISSPPAGSNLVTCPTCGGTGKGPDEKKYTIVSSETVWCSICREYSSIHTHGPSTCRTCSGSGKVLK